MLGFPVLENKRLAIGDNHGYHGFLSDSVHTNSLYGVRSVIDVRFHDRYYEGWNALRWLHVMVVAVLVRPPVIYPVLLRVRLHLAETRGLCRS